MGGRQLIASNGPSGKTLSSSLSGKERARREQGMITVRKIKVALFVDRVSNQWVVRDPDGDFWIIPSGEDGWQRREPFLFSEESELEAVPGHYLHMLRLPF
jgi:hypothetical protein